MQLCRHYGATGREFSPLPISFTYTTLKAALTDWLEDDFADYTDQLDNIIGLAEQRLVRDLNLALFDQVDSDSVVTTAATATIDLADASEGAFMLRALWVNGQFCEPRSEGFVYHYDDITADGQPLYWCQVTENTIRLAPRPDAEYTTRQIAARRQTGLSDSVSSTFLSAQFGDLLFAACKALSENFDKAPEDQATAEAEYQALLPAALNHARMLLRKDYP